MKLFWVVLIGLVGMYLPANPAHASIRAGCAGTVETGRSDVVGWIDMNVMLQLGEAQAPNRLVVTAPDGSVAEYIDGAGLTPPSEAMPVWLAPSSGQGEYTLDVDGYECVVELTADGETESDATPSEIPYDELNIKLDDNWKARTELFST